MDKIKIIDFPVIKVIQSNQYIYYEGKDKIKISKIYIR